MFASVLWPSIALVVDRNNQGVAFGIVCSLLSLSTMVFRPIVRSLGLHRSPQSIEIAFVFLSFVSGVFAAILWKSDELHGAPLRIITSSFVQAQNLKNSFNEISQQDWDGLEENEDHSLAVHRIASYQNNDYITEIEHLEDAEDDGILLEEGEDNDSSELQDESDDSDFKMLINTSKLSSLVTTWHIQTLSKIQEGTAAYPEKRAPPKSPSLENFEDVEGIPLGMITSSRGMSSQNDHLNDIRITPVDIFGNSRPSNDSSSVKATQLIHQYHQNDSINSIDCKSDIGNLKNYKNIALVHPVSTHPPHYHSYRADIELKKLAAEKSMQMYQDSHREFVALSRESSVNKDSYGSTNSSTTSQENSKKKQKPDLNHQWKMSRRNSMF